MVSNGAPDWRPESLISTDSDKEKKRFLTDKGFFFKKKKGNANTKIKSRAVRQTQLTDDESDCFDLKVAPSFSRCFANKVVTVTCSS